MRVHLTIIWPFLSVFIFVQSSTLPDHNELSDVVIEPGAELDDEVIPLLASNDGIENEYTFSASIDDGLLVDIVKSIFTNMEPENAIMLMANIRLVNKGLERLTHEALKCLIYYEDLYSERYNLITFYRLLSRPRFDSVKWTGSEKRLFNRILHVKNNFGMDVLWYEEVKRFIEQRSDRMSLLWSTSIPVMGILEYHNKPINLAIIGDRNIRMVTPVKGPVKLLFMDRGDPGMEQVSTIGVGIVPGCLIALIWLARDGISMLIPALTMITMFVIAFFIFRMIIYGSGR